MKLDKSRNTKRSILYGVINKIVTLLFPFIVQTITIKILGVEFVGINGLFTSILSVLSLTELGVGTAIVYSMYKPIAEDDIQTIGALLKLYKKLYQIIGIGILVLGIALTPFLRYFINGECPKEINLQYVFILYLVNTVISYWMYAYKSSLLNAYQRADVISNIGTVIHVLMSCVQIIFLIATKNFYAYLWISIVFTVINNIIISICVDRMYPEIKCAGNISNELKKSIKINIAGLVISKICGTTRNTFDSIFISMFLGLTQAAIYSNYYYIMAALNGLTGIFLSSLVAGVGNSIAMDNKEANYNQMMILNTIYMVIGGWIATCMLCLYQPFMELWMGSELLFPQIIMFLFPIYFYIGKMGDIIGVYEDAAGLFWENRHRTLFEAIANIILNYLLVIRWGAFGIMLATIISLFCIGFIGSTIVIFKYYFKHGIKHYLINQFIYCLATVVAAVVTYWICDRVKIDSFLGECMFRLMICCTASPILFWIVLHRKKDFMKSYSWLLEIVKKR